MCRLSISPRVTVMFKTMCSFSLWMKPLPYSKYNYWNYYYDVEVIIGPGFCCLIAGRIMEPIQLLVHVYPLLTISFQRSENRKERKEDEYLSMEMRLNKNTQRGRNSTKEEHTEKNEWLPWLIKSGNSTMLYIKMMGATSCFMPQFLTAGRQDGKCKRASADAKWLE